MTKEEAVKILKEIEYPANGDNWEYREMAFDMAIKALSAEPSEASAREWCKQNGYVMMRESVYEQDITKAYFEGQNIEHCEDCISRQAVLEPYKPLYDTDTICIWVLRKNIEQIPPVTPKQKMGHWIGHREHCEELGVMPSGLGAFKWCSNCDCGIDVKEWHRNNYNFCPNCGVKMAESED